MKVTSESHPSSIKLKVLGNFDASSLDAIDIPISPSRYFRGQSRIELTKSTVHIVNIWILLLTMI